MKVFFRSLNRSIFFLGTIGVVAALVIAVQSYWLQGQMSRSAGETFVGMEVVADILPPPMYLIELRLVLSQAVEGTLPPAEAAKQVTELAAAYQQRVDRWTKEPPYGLEKYLLGRQHLAAQMLIAAAQTQVLAPLQAGDVETARKNLAAVHVLYLEHRAGVDETVREGNRFAEETMSNFHAMHVRSGQYTLAIALVALVLLIWSFRVVLRSIQGPVGRASAQARRIAEGDLTPQNIAGHGTRADVIGELERSLDTMAANLTRIVAAVRDGSESVATASAEIAQGNSELSSRTEHQASALEETAASMEELSSTVQQNAENARQGNQLAQGASTVAVKGGEVVGQVVETMKGINDSSRKIADIISVIDGIAFQTNILALNAAVEAARAGEQGRGFAVVAGEVRNLAQRSAEAAKEIKTLISTSVGRVEQGTALVDQAGTTMTEVVSAIRRVTDIMGEISAASSEQSSGVGQIGEAVQQMDQATQQNAALVEESAAAAESLRLQAENLVQAVAVFKLSPDAARVRAATPLPAQSRKLAPHGKAPAPQRRAPSPPMQSARVSGPAAARMPALAGGPGADNGDGWTSH